MRAPRQRGRNARRGEAAAAVLQPVVGGLVALCLCGLAAPVAAQQTTRADLVADQRAWLLSQVRLGEATHRDALAQDALARLRLMAPNDRSALLAGVELALRRQQNDEARALLERLRTLAPGSPELARAQRLWEMYAGNGQELLQQARLFATAGRRDEAIAAYEKLFGQEPPDFASASDYWRLRGAVAGQRRLAIARLLELDRLYPGNPELRQGLVQLLFAEDRDAEALALLHRMAGDPATAELAARRELDYLQDQPADEANVAQLREFLDRYPQSQTLADARGLYDQRQAVVADPGWRAGRQGQALLARNASPAQAEALFRRALQAHPDDAGLLGGLGQSLSRQGKRQAALEAFQRAAAHEQDASRIGKWHDLEQSTRYWLLLDQGDAALKRGDRAAAESAYRQARPLQPRDPYALMGLADVAQARGDAAAAERTLLQARRLAPDDTEVVRKLAALYAGQPPQKLIDFVASLSPAQRRRFDDVVRDARRRQLDQQVEAALQAGDQPRAIALLQQVHALAPDDIWVAYRLAGALYAQQRTGEADVVMATMLARRGDVPEARYAQALYLSSSDRDAQALQALGAIAAEHWSADMRALAQRLQRQQVLLQARALHDSGHDADAEALLQGQAADDREIVLLRADWATQRGDHAAADALYGQLLRANPDDPDARIGQIESWIARGELAQSRHALAVAAPMVPADDVADLRRIANAWSAVGEPSRSLALLRQLMARQQAPDPQLYRDAARLMRRDAPQEALDTYALGLRDAGLLASEQATPRDDVALTRATRQHDADDWLQRSLRSETADLYRQQNPTLTVQDDYSWRRDGTDGLSQLRADTLIAHAELPWQGGRAYARLERVTLDAGRFATDAAGVYNDDFGSCALDVVDAAGVVHASPGCGGGVHQRDRGVGATLGWASGDGDLQIDLGHTPFGFEVGTWLGGITTAGDLGRLYWSATASRRPLSNSLLSYAGAVDPRSGVRWGGVTANGVTVGLGYDQGGRNGAWSSWSWHRLVGRNVADNDRWRAMGGWYHKLVQRSDMQLDAGLSAMLWHYQRDLSGYTLGQGGYYSPQRYVSFGVPVSFAWRSDAWSLRIDGSLSWSRSRSDASARFPVDGAVAALLQQQQAQWGEVEIADPTVSGGSSSGTGYRLFVAAERRLSDHFVLGAATTLQRSRDYAPNNVQVYVRYTVEPWQGDLPLPVSPLERYSEWR